MYDKLQWRHDEWTSLVQSIKARTLKSGLIQIVAEILTRLARDGVLSRADAFEYLANSRDAWTSPSDAPLVAAPLPSGTDDDSDEAGEEDNIEEEPLSQLVERLDATVFGLVEALDADKADLPRLLDEALTGSLWARQIARENELTRTRHRQLLLARANLIWATTSERARRGHFAMGVGLEAGLALDAMSAELEPLLDRADLASLPGDEDELGETLALLAERLLTIRPFVPDKSNALPANWRDLLKKWVSGVDVNIIGSQHMKVIEDAFAYRLVWALEAIRTRRMSLGWSPEIVAGGAAAALETGVPQLMMAMLIRAGLPSRRAAMVAVRDGNALFIDAAQMRDWLGSNEVIAFTDQGDWPTPETAALWKRFRDDVLVGGIQPWTVQRFKRRLDTAGGRLESGLYRVDAAPADGDGTWLMSPDFQRIAPFSKSVRDLKPSQFVARVSANTDIAEVLRIGRGKARRPRLAKPGRPSPMRCATIWTCIVTRLCGWRC